MRITHSLQTGETHMNAMKNAAHAAILVDKLSRPQPFYRGTTASRLRITERRRARLRALEDRLGPIDASRLPAKSPT